MKNAIKILNLTTEKGAMQNLSGSKASQNLLTGFETTLGKFFF
jgi:hypothetical protein